MFSKKNQALFIQLKHVWIQKRSTPIGSGPGFFKGVTPMIYFLQNPEENKEVLVQMAGTWQQPIQDFPDGRQS